MLSTQLIILIKLPCYPEKLSRKECMANRKVLLMIFCLVKSKENR